MNGSAGGFISRVLMATRKLRRRPALGLAVALGSFAVAFLFRVALGRIGLTAPLPFATFAPALLVAPLVGGVRAGVIVAILVALSAWFFFLPPHWSFAIDLSNAILLGGYLVAAMLAIVVVHALDVEFEHLIAERERADHLFQELQHRVANNLQTVSSILRLQEREITDADSARLALRDAGARLTTMGALHRRLHNPDTREIDAGEYLDTICRDIIGAHSSAPISFRVEADADALLPAAKLLTLSLIVNEVIVNALKYAFPDDRGGIIRLRLEQESGDLLLTIADDGVGLDAAAPVERKGLGSRIVANLAAQLQGRPEWSSGSGTTFTLRFPR